MVASVSVTWGRRRMEETIICNVNLVRAEMKRGETGLKNHSSAPLIPRLTLSNTQLDPNLTWSASSNLTPSPQGSRHTPAA